MRKKEFLSELSKKLAKIPASDREDILEYYDELIEDTIEKTGKYEEDVVRDLGSIDDIVKRVTPTEETNSVIDDEKIHYDEVDEEKAEVKNSVNEDNSKPKKEKCTKNNNDRVALIIIIAILTFPVWFSLLMALFGIVVAVVCSGFGVGIAGVVLLINGFITIASNFTYAAMQIGVGLAMTGICLIVTPLIIKFVFFLMKSLDKFGKWLFNGNRRTA